MKLPKGEPVDPAEIHFRCVPTFDVSDPALAWLTGSVFIGTGARFPDREELALFGWVEQRQRLSRHASALC